MTTTEKFEYLWKMFTEMMDETTSKDRPIELLQEGRLLADSIAYRAQEEKAISSHLGTN